MPQTVIVLRPFVFTYPAKTRKQLVATEMKVSPDRDHVTKDWIPTERELPDEVAQHPWICEHFADGAIERPEKTKARMDAAAEKQKREAESSQKIIQQAEAALARTAQGAQVTQVRNEDLTRELDTPVSQLRSQQGLDIDPPETAPAGKVKKG